MYVSPTSLAPLEVLCSSACLVEPAPCASGSLARLIGPPLFDGKGGSLHKGGRWSPEGYLAPLGPLDVAPGPVWLTLVPVHTTWGGGSPHVWPACLVVCPLFFDGEMG